MNQIVNNKLRIPETLRKVKNIVGVFSAKGGVGKSAVALQIAISLKNTISNQKLWQQSPIIK